MTTHKRKQTSAQENLSPKNPSAHNVRNRVGSQPRQAFPKANAETHECYTQPAMILPRPGAAGVRAEGSSCPSLTWWCSWSACWTHTRGSARTAPPACRTMLEVWSSAANKNRPGKVSGGYPDQMAFMWDAWNPRVPLWSCRGAGKSCTLLGEPWSWALPGARLWAARCLVGRTPASRTCSPPSGLHRRGSRRNGPRDPPSDRARTVRKRKKKRQNTTYGAARRDTSTARTCSGVLRLLFQCSTFWCAATPRAAARRCIPSASRWALCSQQAEEGG